MVNKENTSNPKTEINSTTNNMLKSTQHEILIIGNIILIFLQMFSISKPIWRNVKAANKYNSSKKQHSKPFFFFFFLFMSKSYQEPTYQKQYN